MRNKNSEKKDGKTAVGRFNAIVFDAQTDE